MPRPRNLVLALLALAARPALATDVTIGGSTYTLAAHPRLFLDGPSGTITARLRDPDGAGARVAPQATDANPAYVALKAQVRDCRAAPTFCSNRNERSITVLALALDWYMDNRQTDSLAAATHWLNNVETWVTNRYGFGCDVANSYCGTSSWSDWPSWDMGVLAQAYSLVRSEMSSGGRLAYAQKMFNDDVAGYQDGCANQLQQEVGATATFTTGSAAVTGTNLSGLTAGRIVYIKAAGTRAGGWATIQTVNGAASITLTGAPQYALGGNATGVTVGQIYELKPWTPSTCGLAWTLQHHAFNPAHVGLTGYVVQQTAVQYTIGATSIAVWNVKSFPAPPFFVRMSTGEIMKVTSVDGTTLTVERGQLGTNAAAGQYPPRPVTYTRYLPTVGTADYANNLIIHKLYGYLLAGIALADDSPRAASYAGWAADVWLTSVYPLNRDMWTGFQQGGSTNYGPGRQLSDNFSIVAALKNIPAGASPSLDKSGGVWLTQFTNSFLYSGLPSDPSRTLPWGQPDIAQHSDYHAQMWAPFQTYLLGASSDQAKYWNYLQRTVARLYTSSNLTAGSNERMIPWALMFWQESDASADYRSVLATEKAFTAVDGRASRALGAWISRTGWSASTDSLVFLNAFNINVTQDHIGTGAPGAYRLYKNGWVLSENGPTDKDTGAGGNSNMPQFGGAANLAASLKRAAQDQRVDIDKEDSGTGWAFTRTNIVNAYTATAAATRALRYLVHFKKASSPDYLVAFDDLATSSAKTIGFNLFYDKTSGEASSITITFPDVIWTGPNRRVSTRIVLPAGTEVARTYKSLTHSHQVYTYASMDGSTAAAVTAAEFLVVHRPSTSTRDVMPTTAALGTIDRHFVGVQIEGTAPSVAVFPKAGVHQTSTSFTTTHPGTGQYVVTGLETGTYDVVRGETTVLDDEAIDENGTIAFESVAGAFAIRRSAGRS